MSTIAGVLYFDARPVAGAEWDHVEPGLGLAERGDCVWSGAVASGPRVASAAGLVITWDGRLDNADDLRLRLGVDAGVRCDRDLALAVFERWGVAGLDSLVGDWSLAIWDRSRRTLHLARDYMGSRPLYYCADLHGIAWSGDLGELVNRCERREALSDAFAARFMSLSPAPDLTPYELVNAVPAGTCVSVTSSRLTTTRFWTLRIGQIRYADRGRYEEELRALWREAVGARLRTTGTVWAELSGGLDSSSVVCMADRLIGRGDATASALRLVSHATLQSPEGDERRFIAEVERQVGVHSEIVGVEEHQAHIDRERAWISPYALQGVGLETVRRVRARGGRIVLSGRLGDAIMGCQPDNSEAVFEDFARGHIAAALRNMRAWSRATRKPFIEIAWKLVAPDVSAAPESSTALLTPRLRAMLVDSAPAPRVPGLMRSKRTLARLVLGYALGGRLDIPLHPPDVVYTYPFAHRPLVEFVLAIPGEELSAPDMTRSLMRRAFENLLPPRILNRRSKGYYPPAAFRSVRRQVASIANVDRLEVVQRGWIDADRLRLSLRTLTGGGGETGSDIHSVLRLEKWLQARRARSAISPRKEVNAHAVLNA